MKLLFDQNISFRIVKELTDVYPGCKHLSECGLLNSEDIDIWRYARKNDLAIVTFDSDFFEISLIKGHPPKIIWIRSGNTSTKEIAVLLKNKSSIINKYLKDKEFEEIACLEIY